MHVFTISLKFIQENIMGALINNESDCFHYLLYKNVIFPENIYVINMSEDTPECTKSFATTPLYVMGDTLHWFLLSVAETITITYLHAWNKLNYRFLVI